MSLPAAPSVWIKQGAMLSHALFKCVVGDLVPMNDVQPTESRCSWLAFTLEEKNLVSTYCAYRRSSACNN